MKQDQPFPLKAVVIIFTIGLVLYLGFSQVRGEHMNFENMRSSIENWSEGIFNDSKESNSPSQKPSNPSRVKGTSI